MADDEAAAQRQKARLATLAGIAQPVQHELNNLLTVIFANLELLKRTAAEGGPQRQLDRIGVAAKRFEHSTRAILSLSRRPVPEVVALPPAEAVRALAPLLAVLLPAPGALELDLPAEGPAACLDRAALDEALLCLAREAAAGMPRGTALRLAVTRGEAVAPGEEPGVTLAIALPPGTPALSAPLRAALGAAGPLAEQAGPAGVVLTLTWPLAEAPRGKVG